jgi:hypothetical protein
MWTTFLGRHTSPQQLEIVLALIPSRIGLQLLVPNHNDILTLCNTRMVIFKHVAVKRGTRDLFSCIFCASSSSCVIRYLLCFYLLLIVHLFCSLFDYLFCFHFHWFFACFLLKKEKNNSDPEPCSGISILLLLQVPVIRCTRSVCFNIIISSQ